MWYMVAPPPNTRRPGNRPRLARRQHEFKQQTAGVGQRGDLGRHPPPAAQAAK
jgi:hypothetical protein